MLSNTPRSCIANSETPHWESEIVDIRQPGSPVIEIRLAKNRRTSWWAASRAAANAEAPASPLERRLTQLLQAAG
jgi:hypothetical protein